MRVELRHETSRVKRPRSRHGERGSALIVALFMALVVTGLCTTMLLTSNSNHLIAANERDHDRALFASKAGLNYGYHLYVSRQINPTADGAAFDSFDDNVSGPLDGGSFVGQLFSESGGIVRMVSTGIYRRASRTTELVLQTTPDLFKYGFVGFNEVNLHIHSPYIHDGFELETTIFSNNWIEVHSPIQLTGSMVASGSVEIQEGSVPTTVAGDIFAYALDNGGVIQGDVRFVASVNATTGTADVTDEAGNPYVWYLDRYNPDDLPSGPGTVTGEISRYVVQDGDRFNDSIFSNDGALMPDPDLNVVRYMAPPKLDYQAMKSEALKNEPTFFPTQFQAMAYFASKRVTETVNGQTVTTIKIGTPAQPEFIYVQEDLSVILDPDSPADYYGSGTLRAHGMHIEGGIYTAGDFVFDGKFHTPPDSLPEGYDLLRINAMPYCYPAIVAYSEPREGSSSTWTPDDTPPMMQENQSIIRVRSHYPSTPPKYQGPVNINGLTYAEYESHFHHMASDKELITFNGAQLAYKVHNCDYFKFTYDPDVRCTRFLDLSGSGGAARIVSYREIR